MSVNLQYNDLYEHFNLKNYNLWENTKTDNIIRENEKIIMNHRCSVFNYEEYLNIEDFSLALKKLFSKHKWNAIILLGVTEIEHLSYEQSSDDKVKSIVNAILKLKNNEDFLDRISIEVYDKRKRLKRVIHYENQIKENREYAKYFLQNFYCLNIFSKEFIEEVKENFNKFIFEKADVKAFIKKIQIKSLTLQAKDDFKESSLLNELIKIFTKKYFYDC